MKLRAILLPALLFGFMSASAADRVDSVAVKPYCDFNLGRSATGAAAGLVINAAVTQVLKHSVNEMRPDRSDNSSFPSRHSSYAFALASIASHELYRFSPFWVIAAHTVANAVGMQRVIAEKHYPSDVLAGAAVGLLSSEVGYAISGLIFGSCPTVAYEAVTALSLSAETSALIVLAGHGSGIASGCGIESALRFSAPVSSCIGLGASLRLRSLPVYDGGLFAGSLNGIALAADAFASTRNFCCSWKADCRLSVGLLRNFNRPCDVTSAWSGLFDITAGINRQVARNLSVGARVGCDIASRHGHCVALKASLVTRAAF